MDDERPKRTNETSPLNPSMTDLVTRTMMILILPVLLLLLITPTTTRTAIIALHVPVTKGGTTACLVKETLNVSSGGLQSNPNDDYLFRPWDVWLGRHSVTTATIDHLDTDDYTARYRNLDTPREESSGNLVLSSEDNKSHQQRVETVNTCRTLYGSYHQSDDTKGAGTYNTIKSLFVLKVPPEPPQTDRRYSSARKVHMHNLRP